MIGLLALGSCATGPAGPQSKTPADSASDESEPDETEESDSGGKSVEDRKPAESEETDGTSAGPAPEKNGEKEAAAGTRGSEPDDDDAFAMMLEEGTEPEKRSTLEEYTSATSGAPQASGLKAGYADDNKQYGYFLDFLEEYGDVPHLPLAVEERIIVNIVDREGKSVPNAAVSIVPAGESGSDIESPLATGKSLSDGTFYFYPSDHQTDAESFEVTVSVQQKRMTATITRNGARTITIPYAFSRTVPEPIPLDIMFIMDTTGSMGEEIQRLKTTIELIHLNLSSLSIKPRVRFGMVLYKDRGDEYITKRIPLTDDLGSFRQSLDQVEASGGGDTPEDLQAALDEAVNNSSWNRNGIRLGFIITDAPPHLDYDQNVTYPDAARTAKEKGIKLFSVGTGGLDITGEYILRQISQYTAGKYIFLTYGETGESEGGAPGSVSHHTGTNFQTDKLESIIIRFAKQELSYLSDKPIETEEPYFEAAKIEEEEREDTLRTLFSLALEQLRDFSTYRIDEQTPTAVIPIIPSLGAPGDGSSAGGSNDSVGEDIGTGIKADAEYFTEQLLFSAVEQKQFRLVERKNVQQILEELKLQLTGLTDESDAVEVGKLLNAEMIISGTLYQKSDEYELFLKLLRVETGEILSVTKASVDTALGLAP